MAALPDAVSSGYVSQLVVGFALANKANVESGWVSNLFEQCNVPHVEIWEVLHTMYESQVRISASRSLCNA